MSISFGRAGKQHALLVRVVLPAAAAGTRQRARKKRDARMRTATPDRVRAHALLAVHTAGVK